MPAPETEREFASEMQRLGALLEDKANWERRVQGLVQLREALESDVSRFEEFYGVLTTFIKQPLRAQVADLRSAITKEACACVRALACSAAPGAAEAVSDWFIMPLYNNSCATVAVIARAAEETLCTLASSGRLSRNAVLALLQGCSNKHAVVRRHGYHNTLLMLQALDPGAVVKHVDGLKKIVETGLVDAVPEVRKYSRVAFWALESVCEAEAAHLLANCDPGVRRGVEAERETYLSWLQEGELPMTPEKARGRTAERAGLSSSRGASTGRRAPSADNRLAASARSTASARQPSGAPERTRSATRSAARSPQPAPRAAASSAQSRGRVGSATAAPHAAPTAATARSRSGQRPSPLPTSLTSRRAPPGMASPGGRMPSRERTLNRRASAPALGLEGTDEQRWAAALHTTGHTDWNNRVAAFEALAEGAAGDMLTPSRAAEALPVVVRHLSDTHFRVVCAVVRCLEALVQRVPDIVAPQLERVLMPLFHRLGDTKEQVREVTRATVESLRSAYGIEVLLPVLHRLLDQSHTKVRVAAVDLMGQLTQAAPQHFQNLHVLRGTLGKCLNVLCRRPPLEIQRAVLAYLAALYDVQRELFVQQVAALSPGDQAEAMEHLRRPIPQLPQDVRRMAHGETLLSHPAARSPENPRASAHRRHVDPLDQSLLRRREAEHRPAAQTPPRRTFERTVSDTKLARASGGPSGRPSTDAGRLSSNGRPSNGRPSNGSNGHATHAPAPQYAQQAQQVHSSSSPPPSEGGAIAAYVASRQRPPELRALEEASVPEERRAALQRSLAALRARGRVWDEHFDAMAAFPVSYAADAADHGLRALALQHIAELARSAALQPRAERHLEHLLRATASCLDDPFPEVQADAVGTFRLLMAHFAPREALRELIGLLGALLDINARCLLFTLRELSGVFSRGRGDVGVRSQLPAVLALLTAAFAHPNSEVRKTVVLNLVDLYMDLREALLPQLTALTVSQLKLVSIYINRRAQELGEPGHIDLQRLLQDAGLIEA